MSLLKMLLYDHIQNRLTDLLEKIIDPVKDIDLNSSTNQIS